MEGFLIGSLAAALFIFIIFLLVKSSNSFFFSNGLRSPGPFGYISYYTYLVMILPGLFYLIYIDRSEVLLRGVSLEVFKFSTLWLLYGLVLPVLIVWGVGSRLNKFSFNGKLDSDRLVIIIVACICFFALYKIYNRAGDLPLFNLFSGDIRVVRRLVRPDVANYSPYLKSLVDTLAPFSFAYLGAILGARVKIGVAWIFLLLFVAFVSSIWSGEKANLVVNVFFMYLSYLYLSGKRFGFFKILFFTIFLLFLLSVIYFLSYGHDSIVLVLESIFKRAFMGQIVGYYQGLQFLEPEFSRTANFIPASSMLGLASEPVGRELMLFIHGETDTNNQILSFYLMEAWAAWGVIGLLVSPLIVGFCMVVWPYIMLKVLRRFAGLRFCLSSIFALMLSLRVSGGFSYFAFSKGIIFPLVLFLSIAIFVYLCNALLFARPGFVGGVQRKS